MSRRNELLTLKKLVKDILEQVPETRNSDMLLYFAICAKKNASALDMPFGTVITSLDDYDLPPFESVRRARQKAQADYPHLAASNEVQLFRAENEEMYREFARGV